MMKFGNYQRESFLDITQSIGNIDWDQYKGTNKQIIKELTEEIRQQIATRVELKEGLF